ncbi:ArsC family protein [Caldalkalibacillus thermarum TA2.A1]|uniref:ArsC family protein n=1 Tax=Caldalkalibacillus thermarum (strain TA2.A1) TaxID=986075 RepID=F5LAG8_CALTT|nr:Spx/MgsR family RNA polymerase-binding regulatory protein [Caldalkalibacillus thermarum]EGL81717.1 ArsC family protein [Caldalkalibacillus thermarum TA2.A1]QZT33304.1 Spx/MgsR family RNA polymerase-binding regulatory protein [Caldalkalibacillus thermarum TA2.A1]
MIQLYTFSSCTSCRKARDILNEHQIPFKEKNMSIDPLTREELLHILTYTTNGTSEITSKRSQDVKNLSVELDDLSLNEWIELAVQHPGILRRPLLVADEQLIVGFNKEEYAGFVKKYKLRHEKEDLTPVACS